MSLTPAFELSSLNDELMTAARTGDRNIFDRLCWRRDSSVTSEMLTQALVEAAKNKQIALLKHIHFRLLLGNDYPQQLSASDWNTVIFESFKANRFDMLEVAGNNDSNFQRSLLLFGTKKMIEENWDMESMSGLMRGFFTNTSIGFSEDFIDLCRENERPDIYQAARRIAAEVTDHSVPKMTCD